MIPSLKHAYAGHCKNAGSGQDALLEDTPSLLPILPFGSSYVGYRRGGEQGTPWQGALRGMAGGLAGAMVGNGLGRTIGQAVGGSDGHKWGPLLGLLAGGVGDIYGTHIATRGMLDSSHAPKTAGWQSMLMNGLGRVGSFAVAHPLATRAAVTGALGAGVGAVGGAAGAQQGHRLAGALRGGLAGGAVGAGAGAGTGYLMQHPEMVARGMQAVGNRIF